VKQRTATLTGTRDTLRRIADEAQRNALAAEDTLAALEDREARRTTRSGTR